MAHGTGSGTTGNLLERVWTLLQSGVAHGERYWAGVCFVVSQLGAVPVTFSLLDERVDYLHLQVRWTGSDCCLCQHALNNKLEYPVIFKCLKGVLGGSQAGNSNTLGGATLEGLGF